MDRPTELTDEDREALRADGFRPVEIWIRPSAEGARLEAAVAEMRLIANAEDVADLDLFMNDCLEDELRLIDEAERKAGLPSPLGE